MTLIEQATQKDIRLLSDIGMRSFIESHGHSAAREDIDKYVGETYSETALLKELTDLKNIYYIIFYEQKPAGYSKIIFNSPHKEVAKQNVTKLERLYLLKEFYGADLGTELLNFNIKLSKNNDQTGMWLYTWKENERAITFYRKFGFQIIGSADFWLTPTHANPNHLMYWEY